MTRVLPRALQDSINRKVRERDQVKFERSVAGSDAFDVAPHACDEAKPHDALAGLPWSGRARQVTQAVASYVPTFAQARGAIIAAGKFAGLAVPCGAVGALAGVTNRGVLFGFVSDISIVQIGDMRPAARVGAMIGLTGAALVAAKRYELAAALGAAVGIGTVANGAAMVFFTMPATLLMLLGPGLANLGRWLLEMPTTPGDISPTAMAFLSKAGPLVQGVVGAAGAAAGACETYRELRQKPASDAAANV